MESTQIGLILTRLVAASHTGWSRERSSRSDAHRHRSNEQKMCQLMICLNPLMLAKNLKRNFFNKPNKRSPFILIKREFFLKTPSVKRLFSDNLADFWSSIHLIEQSLGAEILLEVIPMLTG
jgi:hypothetical protein